MPVWLRTHAIILVKFLVVDGAQLPVTQALLGSGSITSDLSSMGTLTCVYCPPPPIKHIIEM